MRLRILASIVVVAAVWAAAQSHVRAVRISLVRPDLEAALSGGSPWQKAMAGEPVVEGERLRTAGTSRAEVELECGSALRLDSSSELAFTRLATDAKGVRLTGVKLATGGAQVTFYDNDEKGFQMEFAGGGLTSKGGASVRLALAAGGAPARIAVLAGKAVFTQGTAKFNLSKNQLLTLDAGGRGVVGEAGVPDAFTAWARQRDAVFLRALIQAGLRSVNAAGLNAYDAANIPPPSIPLPSATDQNAPPQTILNRAYGGGISSAGTQGAPPIATGNLGSMLVNFFSLANGNPVPMSANALLPPASSCGG